ncbi:hypothetical protein ACFVAM_34750, partial [Streptomyces californicus]|uniref:hypothetical protein n=1 Tax=Streptomyces californicus TaxID=67351 RepID=UPI0036B8E251
RHAAIVGPKLRGWYDRKQLLEVGVSIANSGREPAAREIVAEVLATEVPVLVDADGLRGLDPAPMCGHTLTIACLILLEMHA